MSYLIDLVKDTKVQQSWPFYHLEPQFCGSTFHQISKQADELIHQCVPELFDTIHDVGARAVIKAKEVYDIIKSKPPATIEWE